MINEGVKLYLWHPRQGYAAYAAFVIDRDGNNVEAVIWEGEPGEVRTITYQQLLIEVSKLANVLKSLGVTKGDTVAIRYTTDFERHRIQQIQIKGE